jgi:hypothetical protein
MLQKSLLEIIPEKCSPVWELAVFQDHIIINLPDKEDNFRSAYAKVKQEITACVHKHFPERNEELVFEVRNGSWNCIFKIGKTV